LQLSEGLIQMVMLASISKSLPNFLASRSIRKRLYYASLRISLFYNHLAVRPSPQVVIEVSNSQRTQNSVPISSAACFKMVSVAAFKSVPNRKIRSGRSTFQALYAETSLRAKLVVEVHSLRICLLHLLRHRLLQRVTLVNLRTAQCVALTNQ